MPMFEFGDQDYGSMAGWDPNRALREKLIAESKKKDPKAWSPQPDMLWVRSGSETKEVTENWLPMKQMFGPLWLEEEVAVLFSIPGVGKSALAVHIAESLARGKPLAPFDKVQPGCELEPQRVLYIDFEMPLQHFLRRYSIETSDGLRIENRYQFSDNFFRAEHYWNGRLIDGYEDFTDMLFTNIERKIEEHEVSVLICDNITFLSHSSTANGSIAFRLMNRFQELKNRHFLSILVVAHTPKRRAHMPMTERDLQGSIDISKVADTVFALGPSTLASDLRYIKQIKSRNGTLEYDSENILVFRLAKFDMGEGVDNFFGYTHLGTDIEAVHLPLPFRPMPDKRRKNHKRSQIAYAKLLAKQGLSVVEIGKRIGIGKSTAHRYVAA
ncbi:MAG: AAA family ATPase [Pyrinomonadaceae bacterium]